MVTLIISNGISTLRKNDETINEHIDRHQKNVKETKK